jgi:tRNA pseudouridine38-40 synthase
MTNESAKYSYLMQIAYDGSRYFGWQYQKQFPNTVQGELIKAFKRLTDNQTVKVLGSSRTDSGVHALAQFCKVTLHKNFSIEKLMVSLSCILPPDIQIISIKKINSDFRLMSAVSRKTYQYLFLPNSFNVSPMAQKWVLPFPKALDRNFMDQAAECFIGEHDFLNYRVVGTITRTTIRTIYRSEIEEVSKVSHPLPWVPEGTLRYVVEGNGFLNQMVRLMLGAILRVGQGKLSLSDLEKSLAPPLLPRIAAPVPAHGLTLVQTKFSE